MAVSIKMHHMTPCRYRCYGKRVFICHVKTKQISTDGIWAKLTCKAAESLTSIPKDKLIFLEQDCAVRRHRSVKNILHMINLLFVLSPWLRSAKSSSMLLLLQVGWYYLTFPAHQRSVKGNLEFLYVGESSAKQKQLTSCMRSGLL